MRIILVRHAVTSETGRKLSGRIAGISLSPEGVAAAEKVARNIARSTAASQVSAVYSSPIQRCRETAAILASEYGRKPRVRAGLVEVEYGKWSGRTLKSLYRLKAWRALMADPVGFRFPEGETLEEVRRRAVDAVLRLGERHGDETILACSHGDVIRSLVAHSITGDVSRIHRLAVAPLGITIIDVAKDGDMRAAVINAPRLQ